MGLGAGTMAAHGWPGDRYRFHEINPEVLRLAGSRFSYLAESRARCEGPHHL